MTDSQNLWISLELDPGTADFYGLPNRLSLPDNPEAPFLGGYSLEASLGDLAKALEAALRLNPDMGGNLGLVRFLRRWPRYADLERYLRMGNVTFAATVAKDLLRDDGLDPPPHAVLALLAAQEAEWERALDHLETIRNRAPSHAPSRLHQALCLAGAGQKESALEILDELVRHPRVQSLARLWRWEISEGDRQALPESVRRHLKNLFGVHGQQGAESAWNALVQEFPDNPEVLFSRTVRPGGASDDPERESLLSRAIAADPGHHPAVATLASVMRRSGKADDALAMVERALESNQEAPQLVAIRAQTLEQLGRKGEAAAEYRAIFDEPLALLPASTILIGGEGLLRLTSVQEARTVFTDLVEARPGDALPHQLLARLDEASGAGPEAAERRLREAIKTCGPAPLLQYALGDLLRRQGRDVEAGGLFKVLLRRHPGSPWGHRGLGDLKVEQEPARALEHYAKALEIDPSVPIPGFDYLAGVSALRANDLPTAQQHLQRAVAAEPGNARYWCDLGAVLFYMGKLDQAVAFTGRALALEPGHPGFLHNLAAYHQLRFRRNPILNLGSLWKAFRYRREVSRAAEKGWKRDLWHADETTSPSTEAPPPAAPEGSAESPRSPKDDR